MTILTILFITIPIPRLFADNIQDFLKGENADNPLATSVYIAKTFNKESKLPIRVEVRRTNDIGKFSEGEYTVSCGIEL